MTRGEVKTRVRNNLADAGITFYSNTDIEDSITDAYYWTSIFANTVEETVNVTWAANDPYFLAIPNISNYYAVTAIFDITRKRYLVYKSRFDLIGLRQNYEAWPGSPDYFFIHSLARIGICPQPQVNTSFKVFYRAFDEGVATDQHSYRLPQAGEDCLEFYAMADLLEQAQEWKKAQGWWDKFYKQLMTEKLSIRNRPLPALMNTLAGVHL